MLHTRRLSLPPLFTLAALALLLGTGVTALAEQLPVPTGDKAQVAGRLTPAGDEDVFGVDLLVGDRLTVKVKDAGPEVGLLATLRFVDPTGADVPVVVKRQSSPKPSFTYTADRAGSFQVRMTGDPGGFGGATGNYRIATKVKRAKAKQEPLNDPPGGDFVIQFGATEGASVTVKLSVKKGGADITGLFGPSNGAEPAFDAALKAKGRTKYTAKRVALTAGFGTYEIRGTYDAGATVKAKVSVSHDGSARKFAIQDLEPRFDPFLAPFPSEGLPGTVVTVVGQNLRNGSNSDGVVFPSFWVGGVAVAPAGIENPLDQVYRFPIPAGIAVDTRHPIQVRTADNQGDVVDDAFFHVPPPEVFGLTITEGGPAGGRETRVLGSDLRPGTIVLFDDVVVQPTLVLPDRIDVVAPPHAPGTASISVRDEYGQTAASPDPFIYLDVGSNRIDSVTPDSVQGLGGQTVTVDGADFGDDTVLTFAGSPIAFTRESATRLTFRAPARAGGTVAVRVEDDLQQSSSVTVTVLGFDDVSDSSIPAPNAGTGVADGWRATILLVGRVNADQIDDLVLIRPAAAFGNDAQRSRVRLLLGDGTGGYTDGTSGMPAVSAADDWRALDAALVNVDGDSDLDLLLLTTAALDSGNRSSLRLLRNDGTGTFTDDTATAMPAASSWGDRNQGSSLVAVDTDGQNGVDIVIAHDTPFEETIDVSPPIPDPPPFPLPDPVFETTYYTATRVLMNDGTGIFTRDADALPTLDADSLERFAATSVDAVDLDADSRPELILTSDAPVEDPDNPGTYLRRAVLLLNNGIGNFTDDSAARLPSTSDPDYMQGDRVRFADWDGNGTPDIVISSNTPLVSPGTGAVSTAPALRLYTNNGSGAFSRVSAGILSALDGDDVLQSDSALLGDLTGDSRPEIVLISARSATGTDRAARVLRWNGSAFEDASEGLPSPTQVDDGRGAGGVLTDVDSDGDLDILIGRDEPDETLRNTRVLQNPRLD